MESSTYIINTDDPIRENKKGYLIPRNRCNKPSIQSRVTKSENRIIRISDQKF